MVEAARPWRTSVRRRRKLGRVTIISLWLHLTVLALFVVAVHYAPPMEEELPPPSTVAMVFEGGAEERPFGAEAQPERPAALAPANTAAADAAAGATPGRRRGATPAGSGPADTHPAGAYAGTVQRRLHRRRLRPPPNCQCRRRSRRPPW